MKNFDISRFRILIVDDNAFMREILTQILRSFHISKIAQADNVKEAYSKLKIFNPDLILVDWEMKPLSGLEFIKMVRSGEGDHDRYVPIIMCTEFSEHYRITEARDAGINELIVKPVSVNLVYTRIMAIVDRPRPFVDSPNYFGPDRRRKQIKFDGKEQRSQELDIEIETLEDADY